MTNLYFQNSVFSKGWNVSIRRGIKWDTLPKNDVCIVDANDSLNEDGTTKVLHVVDIQTKVLRFCDLTDNDLQQEHDPECRTVSGLLEVMKNVYSGFDERELVTLVTFSVGM